MSKKSWFMVYVMLTALLFMGAVRIYQFGERKYNEYMEKQLNDGDQFTFQKIPVALPSRRPEKVSLPVDYVPPAQDVFIEEKPLDQAAQIKQAQDTITSIIDDFRNEEALRSFNAQLQEVSNGQMQSLDDLTTQDLRQFIQANPEIEAVVSRHMQQPDFAKLINEIFSNPQFQQSVRELQGETLPHATPTEKQQE